MRRLTVEEHKQHYVDELVRRYQPMIEELNRRWGAQLLVEAFMGSWPAVAAWYEEQSYRRAFPGLPWHNKAAERRVEERDVGAVA